MTIERLTAAYPALSNVAPALAADITAQSHPFAASARTPLFEPGHACEGLPFVVSGAIGVSRPLPNGQDVPLYRVGPGDLCAVSVHALLSRSPYAARLQALDDVHGVMLPAELVFALVDAEPPFRHALLHALASRVGSFVGLVEQVAAARLDERLARLLVERGPVLTVTHQALADELGTAREVVSRILEAFKTRGGVHLRRGRVEVLDAARLGPVVRSTSRHAATPAEPQPLAG